MLYQTINKGKFGFIIALFIFGMASCTSSNQPPPTETQGQTPTGNEGAPAQESLQVLKTIPADTITIAAKIVGIDISALFSEPLKADDPDLKKKIFIEQINPDGSVECFDKDLSVTGNECVNRGSVTVTSDIQQNDKIVLKHTLALPVSSSLRVTIKGGPDGIQAESGKTLEGDEVFSFKTGAPIPLETLPSGVGGNVGPGVINPNLPGLPPINTQPIQPINPNLLQPSGTTPVPAIPDVVSVEIDGQTVEIGKTVEVSPFTDFFTVNFNKAIDPATIVLSRKTLSDPKVNIKLEDTSVVNLFNKVNISNVSNNGTSFQFAIDEPLKPTNLKSTILHPNPKPQEYILTILSGQDGPKDLNGTPMAHDRSFFFVTSAE